MAPIITSGNLPHDRFNQWQELHNFSNQSIRIVKNFVLVGDADVSGHSGILKTYIWDILENCLDQRLMVSLGFACWAQPSFTCVDFTRIVQNYVP